MNGPRRPITADEIVLRRIHQNHCARDGPQLILPAAFRPTGDDVEGLSVFRASLVLAAQVAAAGRKPGEYFVAALSVGALLQLGLTVVADDQPGDLPGHALIPELSGPAYQQGKKSLKLIVAELARIASQHIVHRPDA